MNKNHLQNIQNPPAPSETLRRIGERVFDKDWNEVPVKNKNGWRCVERNGAYTGVRSLADKTGYAEPIYHGPIFYSVPWTPWSEHAAKHNL